MTLPTTHETEPTMTEGVTEGVTENVADRLLEAVERVGAPLCVGLDPVLDRLPSAVTRPAPDSGPGDAPGDREAIGSIRTFSMRIVEAVAGIVPCVKLQSACFERYGHLGVQTLADVVAAARERDLVVIIDAKRGDIGISAEHYAAAVFGAGAGRPGTADWVTINPYFGADGVEPFLATGRGAFALVRTSNPGGDAIQSLRLAGGGTVADGVATLVAELGRATVGTRGYSALGAVVGATKPEDAARLRELMPQQIFLVPGVGAQGGRPEDLRPLFDDDGHGAIVSASRAVIYPGDPASGRWTTEIADAARRLADEVGRAAGLR